MKKSLHWQTNITPTIKKRKITYFGNMIRRNYIHRLLLEGPLEGKEAEEGRVIWGCRNGYEYHPSTLSCPIRFPHVGLTPHFPYLFYTSLSTWFYVFLHGLFPGTGASNVRLSMCPSSICVAVVKPLREDIYAK